MIKDCLSDIGHRTLIMGILNVTPDSFSDGGLFVSIESAIEHANKMIEDGADIIDIGGESTRPGAEAVPVDVELNRVIPVISELSKSTNICISIDTYKSSVAKIAIDNGACIVNDISALSDPDMAGVVAKSGVPIILMHKKGSPKDMQISPHYDSLIDEIIQYLQDKISIAEKSGISPDKIVIDPGIGFGKTVEHNLEILRRLGEFKSLGKPILIGTSRKSFIGKILNIDDPKDRVDGTSATVAIAIANGADIIRVHDVRQMKMVARMADAIVRGL
ncbi:TPA: dihydropteroate synthase [Candidatus Poribacteria bacterium]|nr:dihydropteroate synthase [Candidatus Poribacteria bacterium]